MIKQSEQGYYTQKDPQRFFTRERDAASHGRFIEMRKAIDSPIHDCRRFDELIDIWYRMHGKTLRDHVRLSALLYRISEKLGNPIASTFTSEMFAIYREKRTQEVTTTTANREHAYLRAMFNELRRLGVIKYDNPVKDIRQFKERDSELRFLTHNEISTLLFACNQSTNPSLIHIVKICLATGSRWSEAESLNANQVAAGRITFLNTKSGRNRAVPICSKLFDELKMLGTGNKSLFVPSMSAFRRVVDITKIYLPRGQLSHVLRHSFASHFIMQGGNVVVLKDILGHSEITTTMRYAHLAPEHLSDAVRLNPLNKHM